MGTRRSGRGCGELCECKCYTLPLTTTIYHTVNNMISSIISSIPAIYQYRKIPMLAVEKWAQNRPPLIALFAPQIASFAREIPEMLKFQKKHRLLSHTFSVPDLPSWHAFYRSHASPVSDLHISLCKESRSDTLMFHAFSSTMYSHRNSGLGLVNQSV